MSLYKWRIPSNYAYNPFKYRKNFIIIICNYFNGKLREFYFTKGSQDQFYLQNSLSSFQMKMREFSPENFAEQVVILHNCPKGRSVT